MNCILEYTGRKAGDRFVMKCVVCGREIAGKTKEPSMLKMMCRAQEGPHIIYFEDVSGYPTEGVGTELERFLHSIGAVKDGCGHCGYHALLMNKWGPDECWNRREEIVTWLRQGFREMSLVAKIKAVANVSKLVLTGQYSLSNNVYEGVLKHVEEASRGIENRERKSENPSTT